MIKEFFYKNNRCSVPMEELIKNVNTFEEFEQKFPDEFLKEDDRVGEYLGDLIYKYGKDFSKVSADAGLTRAYVGNIVRGDKNNPKRDVLIAICLAIGTTAEEVQYLLRYAGYSPLYVRRKRDVIIWFGFMKHKSRTEVNIDLEKRGFRILGK